MKKPQLFLLHFAGGNCYSFQFLTPLLNFFEVIPLELPGRGKRMNENLLNVFDVAARDLYGQLAPRLNKAPFLIYGHSMGAYLALKVCHLLEAAGRFPAYLIVSGNAGPRKKENNAYRYLLKQDAFMDMLKDLGGIPEELLSDKELFEFFEPILRADFEVAERHHMENVTPVSAPLYAMMGSLEEEVEEIQNWSRFTQAHFESKVFDGDHFFIHKHAPAIAGVINNCYNRVATLQFQ